MEQWIKTRKVGQKKIIIIITIQKGTLLHHGNHHMITKKRQKAINDINFQYIIEDGCQKQTTEDRTYTGQDNRSHLGTNSGHNGPTGKLNLVSGGSHTTQFHEEQLMKIANVLL